MLECRNKLPARFADDEDNEFDLRGGLYKVRPGQLRSAENIGIGDYSTGARLDVNGQIRIRRGCETVNGYVLTSDGAGLGTWRAETDPTVVNWVKDGVSWEELKLQGMPAGFADGVDNVDLAYDGSLRLGAPGSAHIFIDNDNNSGGESFGIYHDAGYFVSPLETLFSINEAGNTYIKGNVGLGMSPAYKLDVNGSARIGGTFVVNNFLGVNTVFPIYRLDVNGNARINGRLYLQSYEFISSDDRIKFNDQTLEYGLAQIMALKPMRYNRAE